MIVCPLRGVPEAVKEPDIVVDWLPSFWIVSGVQDTVTVVGRAASKVAEIVWSVTTL